MHSAWELQYEDEWSEEIAEREIEKLKCRLAWIMWEWKLGQGKGLTLRILTTMCTSNQTINIKPTACAPSFTSFTHTKPLKFYHFMGLLKKSTWHRVYIFLYQYHHHCSQSFTILLKKKDGLVPSMFPFATQSNVAYSGCYRKWQTSSRLE